MIHKLQFYFLIALLIPSVCFSECIKGDCINGTGVLKGNGYIYSGGFLNAQFNGRGKKSFKNGKEFVGEFSNGKYNGRGVYVFSNKDKYSGEFKNGLFEWFGDRSQYDRDFR